MVMNPIAEYYQKRNHYLEAKRRFDDSVAKSCAFLGCEEPRIDSHVLSKKKVLCAIDEEGHVLRPTISDDYDFVNSCRNSNDGRPPVIMKSTGVNDASVFPGFCQPHDDDYFKELDELIANPRKLVGLSSVRALQHQIHAKTVHIVYFSSLLKSPNAEAYFRPKIKEYQRDRRLFESLSERLLDAVKNDQWDNFLSVHIIFPKTSPFVGAGVSYPETLDGKPFRIRMGQYLMYVALPVIGGGFSVTLMIESGGRVEYIPFWNSIWSVKREQLAAKLLGLFLDGTELIAFKPSWYEQLSEESKTHIKKRYGKNLRRNAPPYTDADFFDDKLLDLGIPTINEL